MIEHFLDVGTSGQLRIQDFSDDPNQLEIRSWIRSSTPVDINSVPWAYTIGGIFQSWRSLQFSEILSDEWVSLGGIYVGNVQFATLHLGETGYSELDGPINFTIQLAGHIPSEGPSGSIDININGEYKKTTPYVRVDGVWKIAKPFVRLDDVWKEVS